MRTIRRSATRQGAPPGGAACARTSPGTDGLASKAGWVREAKATSCSGDAYFRQKRAQSCVARGQSSPLQCAKSIRVEKKVLCLRVA